MTDIIYSDEFDGEKSVKSPRVFIQWKGTDVCLDFHCKCGEHHHVDAAFVYGLKCGSCGQVYTMPTTIALKPVDDYDGCIHVCEPSED